VVLVVNDKNQIYTSTVTNQEKLMLIIIGLTEITNYFSLM